MASQPASCHASVLTAAMVLLNLRATQTPVCAHIYYSDVIHEGANLPLRSAQASPNWLTTLVLAVLLAALTWKLAVRAVITWRRESELAAAGGAGAAGLTQRLLAEEAATEHVAESFDPPAPTRINSAVLPCLMVTRQAGE